jgi:hypothetical protein
MKEYIPSLPFQQKQTEKVDARSWFADSYDNKIVNVTEEEGRNYQGTAGAFVEERNDSLVFVLEVTVDGQVRRFESDRPDLFAGVSLAT